MDEKFMKMIALGFVQMVDAYAAALTYTPKEQLLDASLKAFGETRFTRRELEYMCALAVDRLASCPEHS
jgi:hypothetical protein